MGRRFDVEMRFRQRGRIYTLAAGGVLIALHNLPSTQVTHDALYSLIGITSAV
jgi:hypothetical protein